MAPLPPSRFRRIAKWTGLASCVVIAALWALSYRGDLRYDAGGWIATTEYSSLGVVWKTSDWDHRESDGWSYEATPQDDRRLFGEVCWYQFGYPCGGDPLFVRAIPFWMLLTIALTSTAIVWLRDRRTVKPGCCLTCGYDLRASKKTCPECGTAIASPSR